MDLLVKFSKITLETNLIYKKKSASSVDLSYIPVQVRLKTFNQITICGSVFSAQQSSLHPAAREQMSLTYKKILRLEIVKWNDDLKTQEISSDLLWLTRGLR